MYNVMLKLGNNNIIVAKIGQHALICFWQLFCIVLVCKSHVAMLAIVIIIFVHSSLGGTSVGSWTKFLVNMWDLTTHQHSPPKLRDL